MKEEPGKSSYHGEEDGSRTEGSRSPRLDREDSAGTGNEAYKAFTKDKRARITTPNKEKVEYRPRTERHGQDGPGDEGGERRRSYNPNFTSDNRPTFERRPYGERDNSNYERRSYDKPRYDREGGQGSRRYDRPDQGNRSDTNYSGDRPRYGERNYGDRPQGERRSYSNSNTYGDRKPYGERSYGDRPQGERKPYSERSYGDRPQGERKPYGERSYGDRPQGERKPYGERSYGDRPQGDREPYGERTYGDRPQGDREPYGERTYGDRPQGDRKPFGERSYGDRPQGERRPYDPNRGGYRPGGNRDGYNNRPGGRDSRGQERKPYNKGYDRQPMYDSTNYPTFPVENTGETIRLNRYIAMSGISSRREADEFIQAGRVTVNGTVVSELGAKVNPGDQVMFDGAVIQNEKKVYIVMNKPKGYVTSVEDPHADKTVMDLLKDGCRERVYPVGRLDKNSLGVLLITNDGDLAKKLTHPTYMKKKIYQVMLDKPVTRADMDAIVQGIELDDGEIHADSISYVGPSRNEVGIEIHSGRNRIVRRIFEHFGYRVTKLDRVYFAGLTKQKMKRGQWRFLTPREVQALRTGQYE